MTKRKRVKCSGCNRKRMCSRVLLVTNEFAKTEKEANFKPFPMCAECESKTGEWEM